MNIPIGKIIIGLAIVFVVILGVALVQGNQPSSHKATSTPSPFPTQTTATPSPSTPSPTQTPDLILVNSWSGSGMKTTEPFTIDKIPWNIVWSSNPKMNEGQSVGMLQVLVYNTNSPDVPVAIVANTMENTSDTSFVYETGEFYLTMNAANTSWEVTVFKP